MINNIDYEDYQINYEMYLAETEMFEKLMYFGSEITTETVGLVAITEGVKETVLNYLHKIAEALSVAWKRFKELCGNKKNLEFITKVGETVEKENPNFIIKNYPNYDLYYLKTLKLKPFKYEEMKEYLGSAEEYIKHYYPDLVPTEGKTFKDMIEDKIIKERKDRKCDKELILDIYKFLTKDFKEHQSTIESDIKDQNNSNTTIENAVNSSPETNTNEAALLFESYLLEEGEEKENKKVEIVDEKEPEKESQNKDDNSDEEKKKKSNFIKCITNYIKINADIITTKMKVLRDIYSIAFRIIKHFISPDSNKAKKEEPTNNTQASEKKETKINTQIKT